MDILPELPADQLLNLVFTVPDFPYQYLPLYWVIVTEMVYTRRVTQGKSTAWFLEVAIGPILLVGLYIVSVLIRLILITLEYTMYVEAWLGV